MTRDSSDLLDVGIVAGLCRDGGTGRATGAEDMGEVRGAAEQQALPHRRQRHPRLRYAFPSHRPTLSPSPTNPPPSAGKTTLAARVTERLNARHHASNPALASCTTIATFLPMDGYHLTRAQLSAMPDPHTAHARRGAAFTFDAPAFLALVKRLREPLCPETGTLFAPSFDHAVKDPKAEDIAIPASSRVVVMEGNYLSLGTGAAEWREAAGLMDELWFVEVEFEVARSRLVKRHVASGIAGNEEEGGKRADENDLVNGREIVEGRLEVHEVIVSREDGAWRPEEQGIEKQRDSVVT